jgi:hypothetical protein
MKLATSTRAHSPGIRALALAGVLVLIAMPTASAAEFEYDAIPPGDIVSATFSADFAALVAHRYVGDVEVNHLTLFDLNAGLPPLDLSDSFFGTAAWPDSPLIDMGLLETGWRAVDIDSSFFPALESGSVAAGFLFTDTDDALFAMDTLILTIETPTRTIVESYYGWPIGDENNGFGLGLLDGADLPAPFPGVLDPTGTGFDEEISSKYEVPEPTSLALLVCATLAWRLRRRKVAWAGPER